MRATATSPAANFAAGNLPLYFIFRVTVRHDHGRHTLKVRATDEEDARQIVSNAELCPGRAIVKVKMSAN